MRHTLSIMVENRFGELSRIVGLFSARGYNIESLTVAETLDEAVSCVTLVTKGDDHTIEQIIEQVNKQVRVLEVVDMTGIAHVEREMVLISLKPDGSPALIEVLNLVAMNHLNVIEVSGGYLIIEATGEWAQVTSLIEKLAPLGMSGMVRTGAVAIAKPDAPARDAQRRRLGVAP